MNLSIATTHREPFYIQNVLEINRHGTSRNTPPAEIPEADVVLTPSTVFNWLTAAGRTVYYHPELRARLLHDNGHLIRYV